MDSDHGFHTRFHTRFHGIQVVRFFAGADGSDGADGKKRPLSSRETPQARQKRQKPTRQGAPPKITENRISGSESGS